MDIYKIAVKLTMESNAAGVLSTLSSKLLGVHAHVKKLEGGLLSLNRVKLAVFGGIGVAAGGALLTGLKAVTDQAKELNHQLVAVGTMSKSAIGAIGLQGNALTTARATAGAVHGTSLEGNVRLFKESYSMFGGAGAKAVNGPLAMFGQVLGAITGDHEGAEEKLNKMIRSGDLMGKLVDEKTKLVDPAKLLHFLDVAAKTAAATGGRVGPDQWMQLAQQGGPALATMTDEGLTSMAMAAQGMGGFRAGTALSSLFAQAQGGKMTVGVAEEMKKLGLVKDFESDHGHAKFTRDQLDTPFARDAMHDPLKAADTLQKAMAGVGINGLEEQTKELFKVLGRQTTQRLLSDFIRNMPQMLQERGRIEGAEGVQGQYDKLQGGDYEQNLHNVQTAWHNFMAEVGLPLTFKAIGVLQTMTKTIDSWSTYVSKMNPDTLVAIGKAIGIMGVALVGAGGVAILAALGPAGWLVLGIGALAAAFAAFAPKAFETWLDGFKTLMHGLGTFDFTEIAQGLAKEFDGVMGLLPDKVHASIDKAIESIGGFIRGAFAKLGKMLGPQIPGNAVPGDNTGLLPNAYHGSGVGGGLLHNTSFIDATGVGGVSGGGSMYDAIMRAEIPLSKHPYSETLGYGAYGNPGDLTKMTLTQVAAASEAIRHNPRNRTNAGPMGAFQILSSTMKAAAKALHYDMNSTLFDKEHQEAMASWIAKHQGLGAWEGLKKHPAEMARARAAGVPKAGESHRTIHVPVNLDKKIIANIVAKEMSNGAAFPTSIGGHDGYGHHFGPGHTAMPA